MRHFIFGTGGFAKEVRFILLRNGICDHDIFYIAREDEDVVIKNNVSQQFYMGIGDPNSRERVFKKIEKFNLTFPNLVDKHSTVNQDLNKIGFGNIFCAGSIVTIDSSVGNFNIFNLHTTLGHDTQVGDFCTFSPGAKISGNCKIANKVYFGTNSSILENLNISSDIVVGASALVTKNLNKKGTYVGVPCRLINKKENKNG